MLSDLRFALRGLWKTPRFSVAAALVLALGIGATTAMFSVVYHVCLRPLAYPKSEQLVFVQETSVRYGGMNPTAPATYTDWRDQQDVFQSMAAAEVWGATLTGDGRAEELRGLRASPSLLDVLRTPPMLGRGFAAGDEHVVLLSHRLWQRRFGGDAGVIGRAINLNGAPYTVCGVMPPEFRFPPFWATNAELWVPLVFAPDRSHSRGGRSLRVFGRLKDGVSLARARSAMSAIASRIERANPDSMADRGARVVPLAEIVAGRVRQGLVALMGAVGFLLLIACANMANLLLGRATGRRREIAIRLALGAARGRIARQLAVESLALAIVGGAAGVALAAILLGALQTSAQEASRFILPRMNEIGLDGGVLLFAFAVSCATGLLFGLAPALQSSNPDLHATLKDGGRGNAVSRTPLRSLLVAGEIAVSLMLLAGAGLMVRSFARLGAHDPGFDAHGVLTMRLVLTGSPHAKSAERRNAFYREALDRVSAVPGVESASGVNHLPVEGDLWTFGFAVEGRPAPKPSDMPQAAFRVAFPGYFATMRIPILRGRDFTAHDDAKGAPVVIVNETLARREWPREDAIGKRIQQPAGDGPRYTVVGVVRDVEQRDWGQERDAEFYFSQWQNPSDIQSYLTIVARTAGDPALVAGAVRNAIASLDRDLPVEDLMTMQQVVDRALWEPRFSTTLFGAFAALALALAAVGIYGVISYDVARRTPEIGIRMALGARPADVLRSVMGQGAKLTLMGTAAGIAGALLLTRYLETLLYGVSPNDPVAMAGAAALLGAVAMLAVYLPARRATQVDPLTALRSE